MPYCTKVLFSSPRRKVTAVIIANLPSGSRLKQISGMTPVDKRFSNLARIARIVP